MRTHRVVLFLFVFSIVPALGGIVTGACGGTRIILDGGMDVKKSDADAGTTPLYPQHPDASCKVTIDMPPLGPEIHIDEFDSSITFTSNPPAGGPHYPIWVHWQTMFGQFPTPIPRGYYIHNIEHGGVVLLYKCPASDAGGSLDQEGGTCDDKAQAFLWQVQNAMPTDPGCMPPIRVATVITADPDIPTPIAATTWDWTYTAECQDLPTLVDFAKKYYGRGPESPTTGQALCADGFYP